MRRQAVDRPLGDDDLDAYRRDGFVVLGRILDDDQIAALLDAERRLRTADVFASMGAGRAARHRAAVRRVGAAAAVLHRGAHLGAVAQVLGPDVAFTHTQFITKLPEPTDAELSRRPRPPRPPIDRRPAGSRCTRTTATAS